MNSKQQDQRSIGPETAWYLQFFQNLSLFCSWEQNIRDNRRNILTNAFRVPWTHCQLLHYIFIFLFVKIIVFQNKKLKYWIFETHIRCVTLYSGSFNSEYPDLVIHQHHHHHFLHHHIFQFHFHFHYPIFQFLFIYLNLENVLYFLAGKGTKMFLFAIKTYIFSILFVFYITTWNVHGI